MILISGIQKKERKERKKEGRKKGKKEGREEEMFARWVNLA